MKFYLDESASVALAVILPQQGIDCLTTRDAGHLGWSDEQQLAYAAETGRILFTHDIRDYLRLAREWTATGRRHAGIVLAHQHPLDELVHRFRVFRHRHGSADLGNQVLWLPPLDLLSPAEDT